MNNAITQNNDEEFKDSDQFFTDLRKLQKILFSNPVQ